MCKACSFKGLRYYREDYRILGYILGSSSSSVSLEGDFTAQPAMRKASPEPVLLLHRIQGGHLGLWI